MKKLIFAAAFLWLNSAVLGQSLTRDLPETVTVETLSTLDYSIGYRLIDGEWVEFDRKNENFDRDLGFNAIPTKLFFFTPNRYTEYSLSTSINFKHLKVLKVGYKGQEYLVLNILKYSGAYKYPSIREDWYEFQEDRYIVIDKNEFELISSSFPEKVNQAYRATFSILNDRSFRSDLDNFDLEKKLRLTLEIKKSEILTPKFLFDIFPVDYNGQKVVRFNFKVTSSYSDSFDRFKPEDFNNFYFESNWIDFETFFKK